MKIYKQDNDYTIYQGDSFEVLDTLEEKSIDAIVTDPPYGLTSITKRFGKEDSAPAKEGKDGSFARLSKGFMGKTWDGTGIEYNVEFWKKCFKVLKPGGYLLSFGGTRTFHRIACAIEDAGFEIRDTLMWLYGSGFPKSMDVSKQIDKNANSEELNIIGQWLKEQRIKANLSKKQVAESLNITESAVYNWEENPKKYGFPTKENWLKIKALYNFDSSFDDFKKEAIRKVIGTKKVMGKDNDIIYGKYKGGEINITIPTTLNAIKYAGYGTCLKPAYEPIIMARKPVEGTVADNMLKYGVGGINIDECRVGDETVSIHNAPIGTFAGGERERGSDTNSYRESQGRFPANVITDGSDEVKANMPYTKSTGQTSDMPNFKDSKDTHLSFGQNDKPLSRLASNTIYANDEGSACRYFYCAKASKKDRDEGLEEFTLSKTTDGCIRNNQETAGKFGANSSLRRNSHPTVKPTELMQYLVRLVAPKGAVVLDPFCGSGSTGKACMYENTERNANYKFIGIEMTEEYLPIIVARIDYAKNKKDIEKIKEAKAKGYEQIKLF